MKTIWKVRQLSRPSCFVCICEDTSVIEDGQPDRIFVACTAICNRSCVMQQKLKIGHLNENINVECNICRCIEFAVVLHCCILAYVVEHCVCLCVLCRDWNSDERSVGFSWWLCSTTWPEEQEGCSITFSVECGIVTSHQCVLTSDIRGTSIRW